MSEIAHDASGNLRGIEQRSRKQVAGACEIAAIQIPLARCPHLQFG